MCISLVLMPVMKMMGVDSEFLRWRISCAVSKPSMPGMETFEEDERKILFEQNAQGFLAGGGLHNLVPGGFHQRGERKQFRRRVVNSIEFLRGWDGSWQTLLQKCQKQFRVDRFGNVFVRAGAKTFFAVVAHGFGGHGNDRDSFKFSDAAQFLDGRVAVHARHHDVHQDEVNMIGTCRSSSALWPSSARKNLHLEPFQ